MQVDRKPSQHTKGEWKMEPVGDQGDIDIYAEPGIQIATVYSDGAELPEANADARLIIAAPRMYAVLKKMQAAGDLSNLEALIAEAEAALEIVEGARP